MLRFAGQNLVLGYKRAYALMELNTMEMKPLFEINDGRSGRGRGGDGRGEGRKERGMRH